MSSFISGSFMYSAKRTIYRAYYLRREAAAAVVAGKQSRGVCQATRESRPSRFTRGQYYIYVYFFSSCSVTAEPRRILVTGISVLQAIDRLKKKKKKAKRKSRTLATPSGPGDDHGG